MCPLRPQLYDEIHHLTTLLLLYIRTLSSLGGQIKQRLLLSFLKVQSIKLFQVSHHAP